MAAYQSERDTEQSTLDRPCTPAEFNHKHSTKLAQLWDKIASAIGVEQQGNEPIAPEKQTNRRYITLYTLWFSMNFNLTALFGAAIPLILNMATLAGYSIIDCILGGQVLSAINQNALSLNGGIAIIAVINLLIVFCGAGLIHQFDLYAWCPTLVAILTAIGCGGQQLHNQVEAEPASAMGVLSYAALIAGFFLPWSAIASDFTVHFDRASKKSDIFIPSYAGLITGGIPLMVVGAAMGGAVPNNPSWQEGYDNNSVGGVLAAMLAPAGGFGKFLLVLLALSVLANLAGTVYALTLNCQALLYIVRIRIPRVVWTIIVTAIFIPISMKIAADFFQSLNNFIGVIGYWPASFVAIVVLEHLVIRKGKPENYDLTMWQTASGLPTGIAALGAAVLSFALVIPAMSQIWYVGPIAESTGDIGFEMALAITAILYIPFRMIEIKVRGRV